MFGRKKKLLAKVQSHVLHTGAKANTIMLRSVGFRRGMWVVHEGNLGILIKADERGLAEIHFVNTDGTTKFVHPEIPLASLEVAAAGQIPKERVQHLTVDELRGMGYL